jgi:tRNA nucleotidyltransferase (CCA-adding enzyme)
VKITWKCRLQLAIYYNQVLQAEITRLVLNYFMRIILTHEQTDFDALASLLGASLLDEAAIPVMPRRMNRNVRAFMNLYGAELPFIDPRDLPEIPIREVTLVDTQSMITLKGMQADLSVKVIDHHPKRDDLPPDWVITTEMIGATATLFVEALVERNGRINSTYATLLLLGIYEDTGSLTYSRTTPRDLNAAAILLKHGASLKIATEFLNHPLSPQQQMLYDRLRADAETHHINGHTIILALGDAINIDEELSSIAHKIRDLLDPDAIFLIATIRGGVQMIARSSNDDIDVSQIVAHFGGGGHERAAAALIKDRNLVSIRADLLEILPRYVHPAVTVAQIMSRNPQLLTTETLAEDAASRMQRFGYEG